MAALTKPKRMAVHGNLEMRRKSLATGSHRQPTELPARPRQVTRKLRSPHVRRCSYPLQERYCWHGQAGQSKKDRPRHYEPIDRRTSEKAVRHWRDPIKDRLSVPLRHDASKIASVHRFFCPSIDRRLRGPSCSGSRCAGATWEPSLEARALDLQQTKNRDWPKSARPLGSRLREPMLQRIRLKI